MSTRDSLISILDEYHCNYTNIGNDILFCFNDVAILTNGIGRVRKKGFGIQIPYVKHENTCSNKYEDIYNIITQDNKDDSLYVSYANTLVSGIETVNWLCTAQTLLDTVNEIKDIHFDEAGNFIYSNYWDNPNYAEEEDDTSNEEELNDSYEESSDNHSLSTKPKGLFSLFFGWMQHANEKIDDEGKDTDLLDELVNESIDIDTSHSIRLEATLFIPSILNKYAIGETDIRDLTSYNGSNVGKIVAEVDENIVIIYTFPIPIKGISIVLSCIIINKLKKIPPKYYTLERSILGNCMLCEINCMKHINHGILCDGSLSVSEFLRSLVGKFSLSLDEELINSIPNIFYGTININVSSV